MKRIDAERAWQDSDLDAVSRQLLSVMTLLAMRKDGTVAAIYPSVARLAQASGCSVRTVERRLAKLRELGWLVDTGERKGATGRVRVYRLAIKSRHIGGTNPATLADRRTEKEEQREHMSGKPDESTDTTGETMTTDEQPTLFRAGQAQGLSGEEQETDTQPAPPEKPSAPFRSHAEERAWTECLELWNATRTGTLRNYTRRPAKPTSGGGKRLLDVIRYLSGDEVKRVVLWMTTSAEARYLRESEQPRGFDTIWNHRVDYPEKADDWLDADGRARVAAKRHGVPLPEGVEHVADVLDIAERPKSTMTDAERRKEWRRRMWGEE